VFNTSAWMTTPYAPTSFAVDTSGTIQLIGNYETAVGTTPYPLVTSDDSNISLSVTAAYERNSMISYTIGPNAAPGQHTLSWTTAGGTAQGTINVGDAYPVLTSMPPGIFDPNTPYTYITINGLHLGTNCPTINSSNMSVASFHVTGPCSDTSVVGDLQTGSPGTVTFTATGNGYNGNGFVPQQQGPGAGNGSLSVVVANGVPSTCQVNINTADLASSIQTTLSTNAPGGLSGIFTLWQQQANGSMNYFQQGEQGDPRGPGAYNDGFNLTTNTPLGQYSKIYAEWTACGSEGGSVVTSYNFMFYNFGSTRHTQYGPISQPTCGGGTAIAYIITNLSACFTGPVITTTLPVSFMQQTSLNGTGISSSYGYLKSLSATSCAYATRGKPPGAQGGNSGNTFVQYPPTGACGSLTDNYSIAPPLPQFQQPPYFRCGDQIFIAGDGNPGTLKIVGDWCPACSADFPHFDNWTTDTAAANCGKSVGSLPSYVTEKRQQ